jgi:hypothetical protein
VLNPRLCRSNRAIFSTKGSIGAGRVGCETPQGARRWHFRVINPRLALRAAGGFPLQTGQTRRRDHATGILPLVIRIDGNQPSFHLRRRAAAMAPFP